MSIVYCKEIHDGRGGDEEYSRQGSIRRYTRVFRVRTDSNTDDATVVKAAAELPRIGSVYPYDTGAWCRSRNAKNEGFSKIVWIVTCSYSSEREMFDNPLDDPAEIEWSSRTFQMPCPYDINDQAILNAAGDYFNPAPERMVARWSATVTKNLAAVPSWILDYANAINDSTWELDGVAIAAQVARVSDLRIGKWQERNDIAYRVVTMTFEFAPETWQLQLLNQGFRRWCEDPTDPELQIGPFPCISEDGTDVKEPARLTANGEQIFTKDPADSTWIEADVYEAKDFSVLPTT